MKDPASDLSASAGQPTHAERVATFLEFACWDHHTHGKGDHRMHDCAAQRLLAQHPEIARDSLYTAVVCGTLQEVERILAERPEAAREPGGSRGWTPLLYLCYTRFTHTPTIDNAVEIARTLLDHGANPNDFYMAGDSEYSALVGAAGEGEQDSPRQPYAEALYRLLLERGAGPYDIQVLYNTHFSGDMIWWLELTCQHAVKAGRKTDWEDPTWSMLDMGGYGPGAYFILNAAVKRNDLRLAEWALTHGASPNAHTSSNPKFRAKHALYEVAVLSGQTEMAELLRHHGAAPVTSTLEPDEAFIAACMRLDRPAVLAILEGHPEYLRSHRAMFEAAKRDRPDVIAFLLDLGVPLEVENRQKTRALHDAAANNALRAAAFLVDRGAEIDPRETDYNNTPLGWAAHYDHVDMLDFLSQYSRDVWNLAFCGYVNRLRDILRAEPELAKQVSSQGITPLWWLPDDETKAMEIVELLLAAGANPTVRSRDGQTSADWAWKRGMTDIACRLACEGPSEPAPAARPIIQPPPDPPDVPVEMRTKLPMRLHGGAMVPTTAVWSMLTASRDGDLEGVKELVGKCASLVLCEYNYMSPLHLAVREGHLEIVRYLAERGAVNPKYVTYPYNETLLTVAADRGFTAIAQILEEHSREADPDRPGEESGEIDYDKDAQRDRFQRLVGANALRAVEDLLKQRPELATDPFAFWSEGILMMPAKSRNRKMLELLMRFGARVPEMSKWGREYYFKHYDIAVFLMESGMNPNHMNCHRTTLLHGMAQTGDIRKAQLLLDRGADLNAVDEEFRSTPLGLAARWGQREVVRLLLERGADANTAGAEWATPLAWARKKGHADVEADLRKAGAE